MTCDICGDAGWVRVDVPGKVVADLQPCQCRAEEIREKQIKRLVADSGLTERARRVFTFDAYKESTKELKSVKKVVMKYSRDPVDWMVLSGSYGTGKTHLLIAATSQMIDDGRAAFYITTPELLDDLRSSFSATGDDSFSSRWDRLMSAEVLVLDDFGSEKMSDWVSERVFLLLNHRYQENLPTLIATNIDPGEIEGRIGSRINDIRLVERVDINASDFRKAQ